MSALAGSIILVPGIVGLLLVIAGERARLARGVIALLASLATLVLALVMLLRPGTSPSHFWYLAVLRLPEPLFLVDLLGRFLVVLFSLVWCVVTLYSIGYMTGHEHQADYYGFLLILLAAVCGAGLTDSILMLYVFWEIAALGTWRLVAFYRREQEIGIAQFTLLMNFAASTLMLVGFAMLGLERGSFSMTAIAGAPVGVWPAMLILAGVVTKSAALPMYVWLPEAHSAAPSPMSAVLSGVVAKIGLIAYARVFVQGQLGTPGWWPTFVAGLGVIGSLVAAGVAMRETDYKRLLAFSTVSQLGYIFIGLAFVAGFGMVGAVVYLAAHCLAKAGLFLAAGVIERATGTRKLEDIRGLGRSMPFLAACVAILMLSVVGLPPLLGFFGKLYVILAAARGSLPVAVGAVAAAVMTALYMLRLFHVFTGEPKGPVPARTPALLTVAVGIFAGLTLLLGFAFPFMGNVLRTYVSQGLL